MYSTIHRTFAHLARIAPLAACMAIAGCAFEQGETAREAEDTEAEDTGTASAPIVDGSIISSGSFLAISTVGIWSASTSCTGVIIGSNVVLTAASCKPNVGATVKFYNGPLPVPNVTRTVIGVELPAGVNPFQNDLTDLNGKMADIALLKLDSNIPSTSVHSVLPLSYPGNLGVNGYMVGRGNHDSCDPAWTCFDGQPNEKELLRSFQSHPYSSDNKDGHFLVDDPNVNKGDVGGPFYTSYIQDWTIVHGVLSGNVLEWGAHAKYTSVEHHLSWILAKVQFTGGMTVEPGVNRPGDTYSAFVTSDWRRCAYACALDWECKSYSHWNLAPGQCFLKDEWTSTTPLSYSRSGSKW